VAAWGQRPAWQRRRQLGKSAGLEAVAARQRRRQWQRSGGSAEAAVAAVASLAVEAAAWRNRDFGGSSSALGISGAMRRWQRQRGIGGGGSSSGSAAGSATAAGRGGMYIILSSHVLKIFLPGGTVGYPTQPGLIRSLSVILSVSKG
jgi:hypothetical protein